MSQTTDYGELPLITPPPGEQYNFIDPPNRNIEVYAGMSIALAVASISMLLRLYTRIILKHAWAIEDLFVWIGYATIVTHSAITFTITGSGPGKFVGAHRWNLKLNYITKELLQRVISGALLYPTATYFTKLALFSLYLRLFRQNSLAKKLIYIGVTACSASYLISFLIVSITCIPDPRGPNDTSAWLAIEAESYLVQVRVILANAIFGVISDIYLLIIPIQTVLRLQLSLKRKIGISAVFMIGLLAIAFSIATLVFRGQLLNATDTTDTTWSSVVVYILGNAEVCAGIVCVNTPLFPAILSQPAKKPAWLRLPESIHYFPSRWIGWSNNSGKPLIDSTEGIILHHDVLVEHGMHNLNESVGIPSIPTVHPNSIHRREKDQYHIDISGGNFTNKS